MKTVAAAEGADLADCVRLVVYVTNISRFRPLVNSAQEAFWPEGGCPPRTIVEVARLNQDDIVEAKARFTRPLGRKCRAARLG